MDLFRGSSFEGLLLFCANISHTNPSSLTTSKFNDLYTLITIRAISPDFFVATMLNCVEMGVLFWLLHFDGYIIIKLKQNIRMNNRYGLLKSTLIGRAQSYNDQFSSRYLNLINPWDNCRCFFFIFILSYLLVKTILLLAACIETVHFLFCRDRLKNALKSL